MPKNTAYLRRKEPIVDHLVMASVDGAGGPGKHDDQGHYKHLTYFGCETEARAKEIRQALFRCARYLKVSMSATAHRSDDGTWQVDFFAVNPDHARAYVVGRYGTDRTKWAYDPLEHRRAKK